MKHISGPAMNFAWNEKLLTLIQVDSRIAIVLAEGLSYGRYSYGIGLFDPSRLDVC